MGSPTKGLCDFPGCEIELDDWRRCLCPVHWKAIPAPTKLRAIDAVEREDIDEVKRILIEAIRGIVAAKGTN